MHLQREKNGLTQTPGNLLCEKTFSTFEVLFEDLYKLLCGQSTFRKRQPTETIDGDYVYSSDYLVSTSFQMSGSDFRAWEYYRQGRYHTLAASALIRKAFVTNKKMVTTSLGKVSLETFTLTNHGQSYPLRTSITQSSRSGQNAKRIPLKLHILWKRLRRHSAPPILANHKYIYFPEHPPAREGMAIDSLGPQKPGFHCTNMYRNILIGKIQKP